MAYVPSKSNPADGPSHAIYPPTNLLLPTVKLPQLLEPFLIDSQLPFTPTELRFHRQGKYPSPLTKLQDTTDGHSE